MFGVGAAEPAFWIVATTVGGRNGATAAGILNTGGNAGGFLAPIVTPWLSTAFGWQTGLAVGAAICLVGAACWRRVELTA
jgi:dipeptide/tripeptide permease